MNGEEMVGQNVVILCARKHVLRSARLALLASLLAFLILAIPFVLPALADSDPTADPTISQQDSDGPATGPAEELPPPVTEVPIESNKPTGDPKPVVTSPPAPVVTSKAAVPAPVVVPVAPVETEDVIEQEAPVEKEPAEEEAVEEVTVDPTPTPTPTLAVTTQRATHSATASAAVVPLKVNSNNIKSATPVAIVTSRWLQMLVVVLLLAAGVAYTRFMRRGGHHLGAASADSGK